MPVLHLTLNRMCPDKLPDLLVESVARLLAVPASSVLVVCSQALLQLDGSRGPAAFVELISPLPVSASQSRAFEERLEALLLELLDIPADRVRTRLEAGILPPPATVVEGPPLESAARRGPGR